MISRLRISRPGCLPEHNPHRQECENNALKHIRIIAQKIPFRLLFNTAHFPSLQ